MDMTPVYLYNKPSTNLYKSGKLIIIVLLLSEGIGSHEGPFFFSGLFRVFKLRVISDYPLGILAVILGFWTVMAHNDPLCSGICSNPSKKVVFVKKILEVGGLSPSSHEHFKFSSHLGNLDAGEKHGSSLRGTGSKEHSSDYLSSRLIQPLPELDVVSSGLGKLNKQSVKDQRLD